jgi:L-ascorbate metabolism protein UlaG (beta-lactamase superfamily)
MRSSRELCVTGVAIAAALLLGGCAQNQTRNGATQGAGGLESQEACASATPGATGGPVLPSSEQAITLRWLGTANYELDYKGQVYLLDTFYDRGPRYPDLGFTPAQVKRATAIMIGHAHFDHISDVAPVARQTGAKVIGAAVTTKEAIALGVPASQTVTVKDGDRLTYPGATVNVALARHSTLSSDVLKATHHLFELETPPMTPAETAAAKAVFDRGTFAPEVITQGTMAYLFTLDTGFKILFIDSAGPVTDGDRALAAKVAPVDVAVIAYQGHPIPEVQVPYTFALVDLFKPKLYIPSHHDEAVGTFLDIGVHPLFERIRDTMPATKTIYPLYRSPICLSVARG